MSTNTNASNGASNKTQKASKELKVSEVREEEIKEHIRNFTGNESTIVVADCAITAFVDNIKETDVAAGSNVLVDNVGKINPNELEKGNAVTLLVRNPQPEKGKDDKKVKKDKKVSREQDANEREDS